MARYLVWNENKVANFDEEPQKVPANYGHLKELLRVEKAKVASFSSTIITKDLDSILEAVNNEADVQLSAVLVPEGVALEEAYLELLAELHRLKCLYEDDLEADMRPTQDLVNMYVKG